MADAGKAPSLRITLAEYLQRLKKRLGMKPGSSPPEGDPYAYVPSHLRRGPKGRSGAAVAEIEDDSYQSYPPRH